ncbi:MAG: DUF3160 domain-containing protein [Chloroflexia bacterium]|nr:DUF3160 domain-containing protein [Chloroflexia bacterium]
MSKHAKIVPLLLLLVILMPSCGPASPSPTAAPPPTAVPPTAVPPTAVPADTAVPTAPPADTAVPTAPPADTAVPTVAPATAPPATPIPAGARFAPYNAEPVTVEPSVSHEPIAADLSNVSSSFLLSPGQRELLARNGFVVSPSEEKEFYMLYEKARYDYVPIFVTSDSLLHVYHLLFDKVLRTTEREYFIPILQQLNARMLASSEAQYEALQGTALEEHARRNVAFFGVGSRLLDPSAQVPAYAGDLVEAELALIDQHSGFMPSPLFPGLPYGEDYTQYIPRGHYTLGEDLEAYFRSMMWYGRMTFRIIQPDDPDGREETRRALLIVQALANDPEAQALWQALYEPTVFFVGRSDDLLYTEYLELMQEVYGGVPAPEAFADDQKLTQFMEGAEELRPPRILGMVVDIFMDEEEVTKGFRFMGQRFVPDSYIHGLLIDEKVPDRFPPKGLDIMAVMGSERAYAILAAEGDTAYANYPETVALLREEFSAYSEDDWTWNLYWSWLYSFFPLMEPVGEGYPDFMRSTAWVDKSLHTVLGSWAELRHDTILYAKQAYAELGGAPEPPKPEVPKGYVEPVPEFYARLAALAAMTREGLEQRGLLNDIDRSSLLDMEDLALSLKDMAEKELAGQPLSDFEYDRIRYYGGEIEHLTFAAADGYEGPGGTPYSEEEPQAAVIADVATHPELFMVLEVGVGRIQDIYAVVPIEGELVLAKGGVFSYYEFPWPMDDRLTDEAWREMLDRGEAPDRPAWTDSFLTMETGEDALRQAVWDFNLGWIDAAWYLEPSYVSRFTTGEAREWAEGLVQNLIDQEVMEAHYLVRLEFLSLDQPAADQAIVTTRETWWAERLGYYYPGEPDDLIATRPEHTLGVIYHLELVEDRWKVSQVVIEGTTPEWEEN